MRILSIPVICAVVIFGCGPVVPPSSPHELLGEMPEPADRPMLGGGLVTVPAAGKVTVLDFWATSCEPCLAEMPRLNEYWQSADQERLFLLGVSVDEDSYAVTKKLEEQGITFPQIIDDGLILKGRYLVGAVPAVYVLDGEGRIRYHATGGDYNAEKVIAAAEALLAGGR